jgi:uridine kinase
MLKSAASGIYGITGPAGSGKTYLSGGVARNIGCPVYSIDFRFIGDSDKRRSLMTRKQARSISDFRDSVNQFNWWDWDAIESDLGELAAGREVTIEGAYDRASGKSEEQRLVKPVGGILLVEGALLGPPHLVARLKRIFFMCTSPQLRFERILAKDQGRRSFNEILARSLITEYSETLHYRNLFAESRDRIVFLNAITGQPMGAPQLPNELFIPLRVES